MEDYYVVKIKGRNVFLESDMESGAIGWTTKKNNAIWFSDKESADSFANSYFKVFKNWESESLTYDWEENEIMV